MVRLHSPVGGEGSVVRLHSPVGGEGCVVRLHSPVGGEGCVVRLHSPVGGKGCVVRHARKLDGDHFLHTCIALVILSARTHLSTSIF